MFAVRRSPPKIAFQRLFDQFDQVRIINLPERSDRKAAVLRELATIGIDAAGPKVSFFEARRPPVAREPAGKGGPNGALISHREVIREALAQGVETLLVIEDDVFFLTPSEEKVSAILTAMAAIPWDVIYFGYLEPSESQLTKGPLADWSGRVIGGHFCGMNRRFMEKMLAFMDGFGTLHPDGEMVNPTHRDGAFNLFIQKTPGFSRRLGVPNLAIQRSSRTDLHENQFFDRIPFLKDALGMMRALRNRLRRR